jgi:serine/threonine protein kinase
MAQMALPWLPEGCDFPLHETTALEASGRLIFDKKDIADDHGCYGDVFRGTYFDDTGIVHRMCAKRDGFLATVDMLAFDGDLLEDAELRPFYARVRNDLTAAWRLLGDPHVVNYLAITTTTRQVASGTVVLPEYFIMEEEGENLHKWLEQHPPCAENRAAFEGYVRCILEGLAALHSAGITHRDVKPKNVVICRHDSSMAKIIDLGLAKPEIGFRDKAVNSMTGATPWFMAPEFMDPHRASQAVDVWAVGVMCAEWLLEEQMGRKEAAALLNELSVGPNGMAAVAQRLRKAVAASMSPESVLERVASAALESHPSARPSSIDLATMTASVVSDDTKRDSLIRWLRQVRHVLQDCVVGITDSDTRERIMVFLADTESAADITMVTEQLTNICEALMTNTQRSQQLHTARNIVQSLLAYSATQNKEIKLLRLLAKVYVKSSSTLNCHRAVSLCDRAIELNSSTPDPEHSSAAVTLPIMMHQKANALAKMGGKQNLADAIALYDHVIEINTAAFGEDHPLSVGTRHRKANVLVEVGGAVSLAAAIALYDHVIETKTTALGADHPSTATALQQKANALVEMGESANLAAAVALCDRAIKIKTAALGAQHAETALALQQKANALVEMGELANLTEAVALLDRVLEINTAALGADHPETALTLLYKANVLVRMGGSANVAAAVALYDLVIEIDTAAHGPDHRETTFALHRKANALMQMGGSANLAAAIKLYDRVIVTNTVALGADHPSLYISMNQKATALAQMSGSANLVEAAALFDRVIENFHAFLGPEHWLTATALSRKAATLLKMSGSENLAAATKLYDRVLEITTAVMGANHPTTISALCGKANALVEMGESLNLVAAVCMCDRAIEMSTTSLGSLWTAAALEQKAKALVKMAGPANIAAAIALCDRVIETRTAALGADHPSTATTMQQKANALVEVGGPANLAAAVALYDRVIEIRSTVLGPDHLETRAAQREKADVEPLE